MLTYTKFGKVAHVTLPFFDEEIFNGQKHLMVSLKSV